MKKYCTNCGSTQLIKINNSFKCSICGSSFDIDDLEEAMKEKEESINNFKSVFLNKLHNNKNSEDISDLKETVLEVKAVVDNLSLQTNTNTENIISAIHTEGESTRLAISEEFRKFFVDFSIKLKNSNPKEVVYVPKDEEINVVDIYSPIKYVESLKSINNVNELIEKLRIIYFYIRAKIEIYLNENSMIKAYDSSKFLHPNDSNHGEIYIRQDIFERLAKKLNDKYGNNNSLCIKNINIKDIFSDENKVKFRNIIKAKYIKNSDEKKFFIDISGLRVIKGLIYYFDNSNTNKTIAICNEIGNTVQLTNKFIHPKASNNQIIFNKFNTNDKLIDKTLFLLKRLVDYGFVSKKDLGIK